MSFGRLVGMMRGGSRVRRVRSSCRCRLASLQICAPPSRLLGAPALWADELCVSSRGVAGRAVAWHPRRIPVKQLHDHPAAAPGEPFSDQSRSAVPCITAGGELYAPPGGGPEVLVLMATGCGGDGWLVRRPGLSLD